MDTGSRFAVNMNAGSITTGSQMPNDDDITERFAERAAIAEHDGGLSRRVAEYQAARATREAYGRLTGEIERQMRETRGL